MKIKHIVFSLTGILLSSMILFSTPQYSFANGGPPQTDENKVEKPKKEKPKKKKPKKKKKKKIKIQGKHKKEKKSWKKILDILRERNNSGYKEDNKGNTFCYVSNKFYDVTIMKTNNKKYYVSFYDKSKRKETVVELNEKDKKAKRKNLSLKQSFSRVSWIEKIFEDINKKKIKYKAISENGVRGTRICFDKNFFNNKKYKNKTRSMAYSGKKSFKLFALGIDDDIKNFTHDSFILLSSTNKNESIDQMMIIRPCEDNYMDNRVVNYFDGNGDIEQFILGLENTIFDCKRNEGRWNKNIYLAS